MKVVIQRVTKASVEVNGQSISTINNGLLILLGIGNGDTDKLTKEMAYKIANMRIFSDNHGKMNKSALDISGSVLVVSQFTLCADTKKGNRPSFGSAANPEQAEKLYNLFVQELKKLGIGDVQTGKFGAHMKINLVNDGPVTIVL